MTNLISIVTLLISTIGCKSILYCQDTALEERILIDDEFYDSLKEKIDISKKTFIENEKLSFKIKYNRDSIAKDHHSHSEVSESLIKSLKKVKYFKNKKYTNIDVIEITLSGEMVLTEVYFIFTKDLEYNNFDVLKFSSNPNGFDKEFVKKDISNVFDYELFRDFIQELKPDYDRDCYSSSYIMKIHYTNFVKEQNDMIVKSKVLNNPCNYHFEVLDKFFFKDFND